MNIHFMEKFEQHEPKFGLALQLQTEQSIYNTSLYMYVWKKTQIKCVFNIWLPVQIARTTSTCRKVSRNSIMEPSWTSKKPTVSFKKNHNLENGQ